MFNNPDNQAAVEHFELLKKQWSDNMERLRGLVDEAVDTTALINAEGKGFHCRLCQDVRVSLSHVHMVEWHFTLGFFVLCCIV